MKKWNVDFVNMAVRELISLPIRWGELSLNSLFADIVDELDYPIKWENNEVALPGYASRVIERWLSKTLHSEEVMMRFAYGKDKETEIANCIVDDLNHVARVLMNPLEMNQAFLKGAQQKLIKRLNDERDVLHLKLFKFDQPFSWPDFDPTWAIGKLLRIADRPGTIKQDYEEYLLKEFNESVEELLESELDGRRFERAKFALFGKCDSLWVDEGGKILGFYDSDFTSDQWQNPIDINRPMARRILWELKEKTEDLLF